MLMRPRAGRGVPPAIVRALVAVLGAVLFVPAAHARTLDGACGPGNGAPTVSMTVGTVTDLTIDVSGTVGPNGLKTTAWFEYAPAGSQNGPSTDHQTGDSATTPLAVSALVTDLSPGTTYTVTLVATNDCANLATPSTVSRDVTTASGLSVAKTGTGSGTVTGSAPAGYAAIECGATCSSYYPAGTSITLSATADAGSTFAGWGGTCSGTGSCSLSPSGSTGVTATFSHPTTRPSGGSSAASPAAPGSSRGAGGPASGGGGNGAGAPSGTGGGGSRAGGGGAGSSGGSGNAGSAPAAGSTSGSGAAGGAKGSGGSRPVAKPKARPGKGMPKPGLRHAPAKPRPARVCERDQKSTKAKPCRDRAPKGASRAPRAPGRRASPASRGA